jgi:hypothetical protein
MIALAVFAALVVVTDFILGIELGLARRRSAYWRAKYQAADLRRQWDLLHGGREHAQWRGIWGPLPPPDPRLDRLRGACGGIDQEEP